MSLESAESAAIADELTRNLKRFPPLVGHLSIPTDSRDAALAGISMYPACRPLAVWCQKTAYHLVRLLGPQSLPGARGWEPPPQIPWKELCGRWRSQMGAFDAVAISGRRQVSRSGFGVLLLQKGGPVAFVKVGPGTDFGQEYRALKCVEAYQPSVFTAPQPITSGECFGWSYLAMTPLAPGIHRRPHKPPIRELTHELQRSLIDLPRPSGSPGHWEPMHGDLTSWNLRCTTEEKLVLMDWEEASWGPPGADEVYYYATEALLGKSASPEMRVNPEAIEYWIGRLSGRPGDRTDRRKRESLVKKLQEMRGDV